MSKNNQPDSNVSQIHNQVIACTYDGKMDTSFVIYCPFIPDDIEIRLAILGVANPVGTNVYTLETNLLSLSNLPHCNENNSFNPVLRIRNIERKGISGSYTSRVRLHSGALLNGSAMLDFSFIRYGDK